MFTDNPVVVIFLFLNLMFGFIALFKPKLGFYLLLVITPFTDFVKRLAFMFSTPSRYEINIIVGAPDLIVLGIYVSLMSKIILQKQLSFSTKERFFLMLFIVWCLLKTFWSSVPIVANLAAAKLWLMYVPFFIFAPLLITSQSFMKKIIKIVVICAFISSLYGIFQAFNGMLPFEKKWSDAGISLLGLETYFMYGILRPFSTFSSGDAFSYYLIFALFFMPLILKPRKGFIIYIMIFIALILSLVRTSIILFLLLIFLYVIYSKYRSPIVKTASVISLVLISAVILNYFEPLFYKLFESQNEYENLYVARLMTIGTYSDRVKGRRYLIENFDKKTLYGYGLGSAGIGNVALNRFDIESGISELSYVHDSVSEFIVTVGLIGFLLFVLFFIFFYKNAIWGLELYVKDKFWKELLLRTIIFSVGILVVVNLSGGSFWGTRPVVILFWSIMGISSNVVEKFKYKNKNDNYLVE